MATAAITGTATPSIREADIVAGGKTIIITLTGDTWVTAGATFDAQRQNIINGLDSAQAEAAGWDAQVKANLAVTTVVRTSNTVVTVTLSAQAAYNITAPETVTVTIPASALTGAAQIVATPTINCVQGPATFYVGSGGSDTAAGNTWATRRLTIQSAVTSANTAGDTVYVAPGTYRETVTFGFSGSAGNVISLIGDYTGANTSGVKGIVRITGSNDDISATRASCIIASSKSYITVRGFVLDGCSSFIVYPLSPTYFTLDKCLVISNMASGPAVIQVEGAGQSNVSITNCCVMGSGQSNGIIFTHAGTLDNCGHTVSNCIVFGCLTLGIGIITVRVGGIAVSNCSIGWCRQGIRVNTALSVGQTVTVNNCVLWALGDALNATTIGEIVEDYNAISATGTARTNVTAGANSVARPPLLDPRWFFEAVNGGTLITPFDLASYSTLVEYNSGTGAPATDLRGASVVGTYREWGALEYNANYRAQGPVSIAPIGGIR